MKYHEAISQANENIKENRSVVCMFIDCEECPFQLEYNCQDALIKKTKEGIKVEKNL